MNNKVPNFNAPPLCDSTNSLLLIIDMQERLSAAMPKNILQTISTNTQILSQAANLLNIPVIISEQYPKGLGSTLSEISACLPENSQTLEKICFSCASNKEILNKIEHFNKKQLVITGMEAHICVSQTAIELQQLGYQVFIAADAVCSRTKQNYKNALQRMQQANCIITNIESICFEWLRDASHNQFKTISKLIK